MRAWGERDGIAKGNTRAFYRVHTRLGASFIRVARALDLKTHERVLQTIERRRRVAGRHPGPQC